MRRSKLPAVERSIRFACMDALESRVLFSHGVPSPTVLDDRQHIIDDTAKLNDDKITTAQTLADDKAALHAARLAKIADLQPLKDQLKADMIALKLTITTDKNALRATLADDKAAIRIDRLNIKADKNSPDALAADQAKLLADQIKRAQDLADGETKLLDDRTTGVSTLTGDHQAIITARETESPEVLDAQQKLDDDRLARVQTLNDDRLTLVGDHHKLRDDELTGA